MERMDIRQQDVFISWTGADRTLKDKICAYLRERDICCLESDESCSGDFREWSRKAVSMCTVFLLIYTENTKVSTYVPVEIEEYAKLDGHENRIVPVCESMELYKELPYGIPEYGSAVILGDKDADSEQLEAIYRKVTSLLVNRLDTVYRLAVKPDYMRLVPLYGAGGFSDREYDFSKLYIDRRIKKCDAEGGGTYNSISSLCESGEIAFISGAAGSGKTRYAERLRAGADEDTVAVILSCNKLSESDADLFSAIYGEFCRVCGNRSFFTEADFKTLLKNRRLALIFDGMDEISTKEGTRRFLNKVEDFCKSSGGDISLIFTSRNRSDADLLAICGREVSCYELEKLSESEIETLSQNLFLMFGSSEKKQDFYMRVKELSDEIKANPLLLSQLAIVYEDSGKIPETVVGIYDAVSEITFTLDKGRKIAEVPSSYRDMVTRDIGRILKAFAYERYNLLSRGKNIEARKIFCRILREKYGDDCESRADFLVEYLQNRAIMTDGEFPHKMFLEYFTAVYFYEKSFDDYDEIGDAEFIKTLFSHYTDTYWSAVIKLFLIKADSLIDKTVTAELYRLIMQCGIDEYTLVLDSCRDLVKNKAAATETLVCELLLRSANGTYPPYGPLFWYVPEYELYEYLIPAAASLRNEACFAAVLALVRDVCFMFGHIDSANALCDKSTATELLGYARDSLFGVRKALCELFYLGNTDYDGGDDIYPRCFNVLEARAFLENGCGVCGEMHTPFADELELYEHTAYNELCGEYIGFISCPNDAEAVESRLIEKSTSKVRGVAFSLTENTDFEYMKFNYSNVRLCYIPENAMPEKSAYKSIAGVFALLGSFAVCEEKKIYHRGTLVLPPEISDFSIKNNRSVMRVVLPQGLKKICEKAFSKFFALKSVVIPDSVTEIGAAAFKNCRVLESINLPQQLEIIGEQAFFNCASLEKIEIPDGVREIPKEAFAGCIKLKEVKLPAFLTTLGREAFCGIAVEKITLPSSTKEIGERAFFSCNSLCEVTLSRGLERILDGAFGECESLSHIAIPLGVTEIGIEAFPAGTEVVREDFSYSGTAPMLPCGLAEIPDYAFAGHKELCEVVIPDGVKSIGVSAFQGCENLKRVVLPDSVTHISDDAFMGCKSLESVNLPFGVTEIGSRLFSGCESLPCIVLPEDVKSIGYGAFGGCTSLAEINLPSSITEIGSGAFASTRIKEVRIPSGVRHIETLTFAFCESLSEVVLHEKIEFIEQFAFYGCDSLGKVAVPEGAEIEIDPDAFDPHTKVSAEKEEPEEVTVSASFVDDGAYRYRKMKSLKLCEGVRKIGVRAFWNCKYLETVEFPSTLEEIEGGAFKNCHSLSCVRLPEGLRSIYDSAFAFCRGMSELYLPSTLEHVGFGAFYSCRALEKVSFAKGGRCDVVGAFFHCEKLCEVELPDETEIIDQSAFYGCKSLEHITLPKKLRVIGNGVFAHCTALREIEFPSTLEEIRQSAFAGCEKLRKIAIPVTVRTIGSEAFADCTALESVEISRRFEGDIKSIFGDIDSKIIRFI